MSGAGHRHVRRVYHVPSGARSVQLAEHAGGLRASIDGEDIAFDARRVRAFDHGAELLVASSSGIERAVVVRDGDDVLVHLRGRSHRFTVATGRGEPESAPEGDDDPFALSPMTGVVAKVNVVDGQEVAAGEPLFVVEAMKMEFVVEAPRDVTVERVLCAPGERVDIGRKVVTFVEEVAE